MYDRMQALTKNQKENIHEASMDLLKTVGIVMNEDEAIQIFKDHGFKVDDKTVFFEEKEVMKALETVPEKFTIEARNPEKSVSIGEDDFVKRVNSAWESAKSLGKDEVHPIRGKFAKDKLKCYGACKR